MEVIREVDHADGKGIVWRDKEWQPVKEPKSFDTFFRNRSEETVKAIMDPKTDRLRSFVWFKEREGDLCLDKQMHKQVLVVRDALQTSLSRQLLCQLVITQSLSPSIIQ